ncbi:SGNH/GDSL hydrolase family protein [Gayadomonas joobiniege]|uniref:SGNH/GDSL hydrolase family protein n=1 Tax=Gayadomonas joobiniege TaxID=1234606 RepID=UPI0003626D7C|nr:SGNH/GDSL hydrolase family protein [Gayadomonas joobiniege]
MLAAFSRGALILLFLAPVLSAKPLPKITPEQKVLFIGDSITYAGQFLTYFETLLTLKNKQQYQFYNLALPSETASGLSEVGHANGRFARPDVKTRYQKILQQLKPDLVVICYGINDGIYQAFDETRFSAYKRGMQWLAEQTEQHSIPFIFITAPVYDVRKNAAYANVQDIYAAWLMSKYYTDDWPVIDVYQTSKHHLWQKRQQDVSFYLAADGVHPTDYGHWVIAKALFDAWQINEWQNDERFDKALENYANGEKIAALINKKQHLIKATWLTHIGHTRPGIKDGLPLIKLNPAIKKMTQRISRLLAN